MKIGVTLPITENPQTGIAPSYQEIRALAQGAERAGFDSIWLFDHLIYRFPERPVSGPWECWTLLSSLAEATERVQLGTIVLCTAFRNPAVLAKMAVTLAAISENRLILGLGAGWHEPEFDAFGLPFDHKAGRFEEAIKIIVPLVRDGKVDFHGEYHSAPNCEMHPAPPPGGVPVLIASGGPRMLRLTAEWADSWNTAWFGQPTLMHPRRAALNAACGEVGRAPDSLEVTAGVQVAFPDLGEMTMPVDDKDKVLTGTAQEIADGLRAYDELGVGHVIINVAPNTLAAQERLTEVLNLYRAGAADS
jgi:alkanesulfonate monooxygenase SsuD/methylene tetrahydromethanopterin reductase-like flavin-dependent oxidoreductase (luciferase family)